MTAILPRTIDSLAATVAAAPAAQSDVEPSSEGYSDWHCMESPRLVTVDWCETTLWAHDCRKLGVDAADQELVFELEGGRTCHARTTQRVGYQGWRVLVLVPFRPSRIVLGRFRQPRSGDPTVWGGYVDHPSTASLPDPILTVGDTEMTPLSDWVAVSSTSRELLERCAWRADDTGRTTAVVWRRRRCLHPIVDYWWRASRHMADDPTLEPQRMAIEFPGVYTLACADRRYSDAATYGDDFAAMPTDQAAAPTLRLRASYPVGISDPLTDEIVDYFDTEPEAPAGCTTNFEGRWLALGVMPRGDAARAAALVAECLDEQRASIWDALPGAQARSANQAGTQRFGASFGSLVRYTPPLRAREALRVIASDEELRPVHWYDQAGEPVQHASHPHLRTHNRRIDWRNSHRDRLGLDVEPPKVGVHSRRTTDDEQHSDDLAIAAYLALWSDPALEETMQHVVYLDSLDTQMLTQQRNSAARGVGRPMLSTANAAWLLFGSHAGSVAAATAEGQIRALMETWEGKQVMLLDHTRPIKPVATLTGNASWALTDPRTGEPMRAAAPYEHAAVITGLIAAAQVVDEPTCKMALALAHEITRTVMHWTYRDDATGLLRWPFVIGCFGGDDDGLELPLAWRDTSAPEMVQIAKLGGSWTGWTIAAAYAVHYLPQLGLPSFPLSLADDAEALREWAEHDAPLLPGADVVDRMRAVPMHIGEAIPLSNRAFASI